MILGQKWGVNQNLTKEEAPTLDCSGEVNPPSAVPNPVQRPLEAERLATDKEVDGPEKRGFLLMEGV